VSKSVDSRGLKRLFTSINPRTIYLYSIVIGLLSGLGAIAFNELLHAAIETTMGSWARLPLPVPHGEATELASTVGDPPRRWLLILLPVLGGLISGLLIKTFAPEAEGTGTDSYIDAFHNRAGSMRGRVPLVKSLATISTIASGGSAGKEGPIAQIGAGIGSALGRYLKMGARARRTLMVAGAAGGLGAIFRAPLGGALTAVEVLYKEDLETPTRSSVPCMDSTTSLPTTASPSRRRCSSSSTPCSASCARRPAISTFASCTDRRPISSIDCRSTGTSFHRLEACS
jgi:CIC family chloride channel protein